MGAGTRPQRQPDLDATHTYCHCEYMQMKEERLQVRIDAALKRQLEEAAEELGMTLSTFVLHAARGRATEIFAERAVVRLSPDAAAAFEEALNRPAQVNVRLWESLQRPNTIQWAD
ncbi:MAG: type II toxin-antitoxin system TacA family antitoxin [Sporichthyaceae bacterium]